MCFNWMVDGTPYSTPDDEYEARRREEEEEEYWDGYDWEED